MMDDTTPRVADFLEPLPETLEELYDAAPVGYLTLKANGTITRANNTFLEWLGLAGRQAEVCGRRVPDLLTPAGKLFYATHCEPTLKAKGKLRQIALDLRCADGARRSAMLDWRPIDGPDGVLIGYRVLAVDATERRAYERELLAERERTRLGAMALVESEARLKHAQSAAGIGIYDKDLTTGCIYWDARARELWGLSATEPVTDEVFAAGVHPDDIAAVWELVGHATNPAGSGTYNAEYRVRDKRDGQTRTIASSALVTFRHGRAVRLVGTMRDITAERAAGETMGRLVEERTRDLAETQQRLAQALRMEALGQLAGGIAHDFNNVLQIVHGAASLIDRPRRDPEATARLARVILNGSRRGASITNRLLAFARCGDLRAEPVEPTGLLADLSEVLTYTLGPGVMIHVDAVPELPSILVDKGQLETVLVNLATNARDAMEGNGFLTLGAAWVTIDLSGQSDGLPSLTAGSYVRIFVADTGCGMTPDVMARAVEPFFTTKARGEGTGLGLAMAKGFAEQSGGGLQVESEVGRGTTVSLWLPLAPKSKMPVSSMSEHARDEGPAIQARLLVVDDEPAIREMLEEVLTIEGYAVTVAADGPEALRALASDPAFDLLITDLTMPGGLDGAALIREATRRHANLQAILLTGSAIQIGGVAGDDHAQSDGFTLVRKPMNLHTLTGRVGDMLRAARRADRDA